jgi:hypothetical protein
VEYYNEFVERMITDHDVAVAASRTASPVSEVTVTEHEVSETDFVRSSG